MPRAILAIRDYPNALMLAALLFAVSLILAAGSLGYIGGDDEGSGLGGTGKTGDLSGGGQDGTGTPNPFFTLIDHTGEPDPDHNAAPVNDPEALDHAMRRAQPPSIAQKPRIIEPPRSPGLLEDTEQLRERLRRTREMLRDNALRHRELALWNRTEVIRLEIHVDDPVDAQSVVEHIEPFSMELAERQDSESSETAEQRVSPERIQRPELPPFQRSRPVQRASIVAPPPRPMRI